MNKRNGSILILSGPSGSGKSSLLKNVFNSLDNYFFSISTTTREIRDGEVEGKDYFFISEKEFLEDIKNGYFLEWAEVHGNYYGTSMKSIQTALDDGKLVIFDIDVQGFESIHNKLAHLVTSVFITTPDSKTLEDRLRARGTDDEDSIERRLINAIGEMEYIEKYDNLLINSNLKDSSEELLNIVKYVQTKRHLNAKDFREEWKKR